MPFRTRLRWYGSLLHLGGSAADSLLLRILLQLHLARHSGHGRQRHPRGCGRKLAWSAAGRYRGRLATLNLRAGWRRLETKLYRSLFCTI